MLWEVKKCFYSRSHYTQLSVYADKNHVLLISDNFSYEVNLSFLHKTQKVECLRFNFLDGLMYLFPGDSHVKYNLIQWQSVLTIGMSNFFTVTLHEFYQCTSMSSYNCPCMIIIIQLEFTNLGN